MTDRQLIIVDTETTSLDTATCAIVEVAAINTVTGETLRFVPNITDADLNAAEPIALSVNRYYERRLFEETLTAEATAEAYEQLDAMLYGNVMGGSNPAFDAAVLERIIGKVWHHRLADLAAYVAGSVRLPPNELPGLEKCCDILGVINPEPHTALGDAEATASCFRLAAALRVDAVTTREVRA